jgi:lysophospholipase L1-like esterase
MKSQSVTLLALFGITVLSLLTTVIILQVFLVRNACLINAVDVATFGDSLTDSGHSGETLDCTSWIGFGYQQYVRAHLLRVGVNARLHNYGVGGQTSAQVSARITSALQTDYLVFWAGTNDVWTWDYGERNDTVVQSIMRALTRRPLVRRERVLVLTVPPACQGGAMWRPGAPEAFNEAIWANATSSSYEVVDVYNALVMPVSTWRHPAYCAGDLIHFTDAANRIVGEILANAILRL